ncbi:hypothetical protein [Thauera terpenica]|uniref:hypothetical protein n=1 Tax=Thauera terpenica TaxID=76113 RepID=UPI000A03EBC6|nr:hypothetical protein [Thauera terpenica]
MAYNEAETRYELIDPILREKGYRQWRVKLETPAPVEPTGNKGRRRRWCTINKRLYNNGLDSEILA